MPAEPASSSSRSSMTAVLVQVLIGLVVSYLLYLLSLHFLRVDVMRITKAFDPNSSKQETRVFDGYLETSNLVGRRHNTVNPSGTGYMPIQPSVNRKGGAQFSYSFWLYVGQPDATVNQCIFLRGDPNTYSFSVHDARTNLTRSMNTRVAYCPMVAFGTNPMELVVSFNTVDNIDETMVIRRQRHEDDMQRKNMMSMLSKAWFLVTVVFEDNIPINDFENGGSVRVYLNDTLYESKTYLSTLKQNRGDLCFFPDGQAVPGLRMSNFTYYNYACTLRQVQELYARGPGIKPVKEVTADTIPYYISAYNKLDMYNA